MKNQSRILELLIRACHIRFLRDSISVEDATGIHDGFEGHDLMEDQIEHYIKLYINSYTRLDDKRAQKLADKFVDVCSEWVMINPYDEEDEDELNSWKKLCYEGSDGKIATALRKLEDVLI